MKKLFCRFPKNILDCFQGRNLFWHFFAIALTYIIVISGFDWFFYLNTRSDIIKYFIFPAIILGGLLPIIVPIGLLVFGWLGKSKKALNTAFTLGQAAILGLLISDFYKAFTGRIPPPEIFARAEVVADTSHGFRFGFLEGGVFWGWPSSHTTVAFAMAVALLMLFPKNKLLKYAAIGYALYIGIGISVSIHWFSEFIAGMIIGSVIGAVVGKSFRDRCLFRGKD